MSDPSANSPLVTHRLRVAGHVQGVGFRMYMERTALAAGVTGWVRNRRDGTVEAIVQGAPAAVDRVIAWARTGPPAGNVTALRVEPADGHFDGFTVLPTA